MADYQCGLTNRLNFTLLRMMTAAIQECSKCEIVLTEETGYRVRTGKHAGKFNQYCRKCAVVYNRGRYLANPEKFKLARREYAKTNPDQMRKHQLKRDHNTTPEWVEQKSLEQCGCCAICWEPLPKNPPVDHDHNTGQNRGLLCSKCNFGLGHFDDQPQRILSAVEYLKKYASGPITS